MQSIVDDMSEVVTIDFSKQSIYQKNEIHIIPSVLLELKEYIIRFSNINKTDTHTRYFITFCVLCNSIPAYLLPIISEKESEVHSGNGYILNGNKVLMTDDRQYICQQITGEGIIDQAKLLPLKEFNIFRTTWLYAKRQPRYYVVLSSKRYPSLYFMKKVKGLVSKLSFFGFDKRNTSSFLKRKEKVLGVHVLGSGTKAYPKSLFEPGKLMIIEDQIGDKRLSLVSNGIETYGFDETDLGTKDGNIRQDDKLWNIDGKSLGTHQDLKMIHITYHVYWYLWGQFYPESEIYG